MKSKNIFTVILFYSMVAMFMIALHQNMLNGFAASYVFYMLTFMLFLGYAYRKMNEPKDEDENQNTKKSKTQVNLTKKTNN